MADNERSRYQGVPRLRPVLIVPCHNGEDMGMHVVSGKEAVLHEE